MPLVLVFLASWIWIMQLLHELYGWPFSAEFYGVWPKVTEMNESSRIWHLFSPVPLDLTSLLPCSSWSDISSPLFLLAASHPLNDLGSSRPHLPAQPLNLSGTQGVASGYTGAGHTSSGGYAAAGYTPVTSTPKVQLLVDVQWLLLVT